MALLVGTPMTESRVPAFSTRLKRTAALPVRTRYQNGHRREQHQKRRRAHRRATRQPHLSVPRASPQSSSLGGVHHFNLAVSAYRGIKPPFIGVIPPDANTRKEFG